jgi:hypothetical protein
VAGVELAQHFGLSVIDALGLSDSDLPPGVASGVSAKIAKNILFSVGVSVLRPIPCTKHEPEKPPAMPAPGGPAEDVPAPAPAGESTASGECCRLIVNPGLDAPWPTNSPNVTGEQQFSFSVSVDTADAKLGFTFTVAATPKLFKVDPTRNCPTKCGPDVMFIAVSVDFAVTLSVKGTIKAKKDPSKPGGVIPPGGVINFGPKIGDKPATPNLTRSEWTVDFTVGPIKFNWMYNYGASCDSIFRLPDDATRVPTRPPSLPPGIPTPPWFKPSGTSTARDPRDCPCNAPTLAQVRADATVEAAIARAWQDSHPNAPDAPAGQPTQKQEQGGWIIYDCNTATFRVERWPAGTRDRIGVPPLPSVHATECVVATFHTHPNTRSEGYSPWPSPGDQTSTTALGIPDIVRSHEGDYEVYP